MNKKKIFIAVDTNKISRAKRIIKDTQTKVTEYLMKLREFQLQKNILPKRK